VASWAFIKTSRKNKMSIEKDNVNPAILIVLIAGILWSFGALTVRFIEDAHLVPWQYLFFRGLLFSYFLIFIYSLKKENHLLRIIKKLGYRELLEELVWAPP